jgi:hypothetical protein
MNQFNKGRRPHSISITVCTAVNTYQHSDGPIEVHKAKIVRMLARKLALKVELTLHT